MERIIPSKFRRLLRRENTSSDHQEPVSVDPAILFLTAKTPPDFTGIEGINVEENVLTIGSEVTPDRDTILAKINRPQLPPTESIKEDPVLPPDGQ